MMRWLLLLPYTCCAIEVYLNAAGKARVCPPGYYCQDSQRYKCPNGFYNGDAGKSFCASCPQGSRCPIGSVKPLSMPAKQARALPMIEVSKKTFNRALCDFGHYCPRGSNEVFKCSAGTYGETNNLTNFMCSGICPAGSYCPPGTINPIPCPPDRIHFCPPGSRSPLRIGAGMYVMDNQEKQCERGYFCDETGARLPCPGGTYGKSLMQTNCSKVCESGFYCPPGSIRQIECIAPEIYCPEESEFPVKVGLGNFSNTNRSEQFICPLGFYCTRGVRYPCPAGTWNNESQGLLDQDQCFQCPPGFICKENVKTECGGSHLYCPPGNGESPLFAPPGYYTDTDSKHRASTRSVCHADQLMCSFFAYNAFYFEGATVLGEARSSVFPCDIGHYCLDGERFECPPGTYGDSTMLTSDTCSGVCAEGFYCPAASFVPTAFPCPVDGYYCPAGSGNPTPVSLGFYTNALKSNQTQCEPGYFCDENGDKHLCKAGTYGDVPGLFSVYCSGRCPAGYYCPQGSVSKFANNCTSSNSFCPNGSTVPLLVNPGYYSNSDRSWQFVCEPGFYCVNGNKTACSEGTYGATHGLTSSNCTGKCSPGYFCPSQSVSQTQYHCSDALGLNKENQTFFGNNFADTRCVVQMLDVYPQQFFEFSLLPVRTERDPSQWNLAYDNRGLYDVYNTLEWDDIHMGFRGRGESDTFLQTGWKPGAGPKTMCMWKMLLTDDIYGLDGMQKEEMTNDYFMIGTYWSYRDRIFVSSGVNRGTYAHVPIVIEKEKWVFYCLASGGASDSSEAYVATPSTPLTQVWSQTDNGNDRGTVGTHLSMIYGTTSSGKTDQPMYHTPNRNAYSDAVYGGILHWDHHLNEDEITNAYNVTRYFYPSNGIRHPRGVPCGSSPTNEWSQGWRGRNIGPISSVHFDKDDIGYYHPRQSPILQLQKPLSRYPFLPYTLDNSDSILYCPSGSGLPSMTDMGFYSDVDKQVVCPAGYYCINGRMTACPPGNFGSSVGLYTKECSGFCPAGSYCPSASVKPIACPENHYADQASIKCTLCNSNYSVCQTSRNCCRSPNQSWN